MVVRSPLSPTRPSQPRAAASCRTPEPRPRPSTGALARAGCRRYGRDGASKERQIRFAPVLILAAELIATSSAGANPALRVGRGERLLVIAPHPDDETIGCGGLIQRVHANGGDVRVVLITAGDGFLEAVTHETGTPQPRPSEFIAFGEERLRESRAAVRVLVPDHPRLTVLGFPDDGLAPLLQAHWWRTSPERSRTTGASDPPYDDDEVLEKDVSYDGDDLRRELERIIRETRPTIVALPDPLDRHPDHRAAGLFTLLALHDWSASVGRKQPPALFAYLVHWPDWPPGWNAPTAQAHGDLPLILPKKAVHQGGRRVALTLTDDELAAKQGALQRYTTQLSVMGPFLTAFLCRTEPFTVLRQPEIGRLAAAIERRVDPPRRRRPTPHHGRRYGPHMH
jgi:LmbE family N-acetylglucosaminyl deacetylase